MVRVCEVKSLTKERRFERERAIGVVLIFIVVSAVLLSEEPRPAVAWDDGKKCGLSLEASPTVRGMRLGVSTSELEAHYRGMRIPTQNSHGYTEIILFVSIESNVRDVDDRRGVAIIKRSSFSEWAGVEKMVLKFMDGKLADLTIHYTAGQPDWRSADEFAASLSAALNLPKGWRKWGDQVRIFECTGFKITAKVEQYSGASGGILQITDLNAIKLLESRAANSERRRMEAEDKKKREFKP